MLAICPDTANHRGQVQYHRGPRLFEEAPDLMAVAEIVVPAAGCKYMTALAGLESFYHERAQKAGASGDHDSLFSPKGHRKIRG